MHHNAGKGGRGAYTHTHTHAPRLPPCGAMLLCSVADSLSLLPPLPASLAACRLAHVCTLCPHFPRLSSISIFLPSAVGAQRRARKGCTGWRRHLHVCARLRAQHGQVVFPWRQVSLGTLNLPCPSSPIGAVRLLALVDCSVQPLTTSHPTHKQLTTNSEGGAPTRLPGITSGVSRRRESGAPRERKRPAAAVHAKDAAESSDQVESYLWRPVFPVQFFSLECALPGLALADSLSVMLSEYCSRRQGLLRTCSG